MIVAQIWTDYKSHREFIDASDTASAKARLRYANKLHLFLPLPTEDPAYNGDSSLHFPTKIQQCTTLENKYQEVFKKTCP